MGPSRKVSLGVVVVGFVWFVVFVARTVFFFFIAKVYWVNKVKMSFFFFGFLVGRCFDFD